MVYRLLFGEARSLLDAVVKLLAWSTIAVIVGLALGFDPIAAAQSIITDLINPFT